MTPTVMNVVSQLLLRVQSQLTMDSASDNERNNVIDLYAVLLLQYF